MSKGRWQKVVVAAVLFTLLLGGLAFAGGQEDGSSAKKGPITIGLSHINFTHEFFRGWISEQEKCDAYFGTKTIHKSCESNIDKQLSDIESFIAMKADVIMVNPIDVVGVKPAVKAALDAGIPTMSTANVIEVEGNVNALLPEYQLFSNMASILAALLNYEGNVLWLGGQVGNWASDIRQKGFMETMAKYPKIKVLGWAPGEWDGNKAVSIVQGWMTTYDKIDAIGCMDDGMGLPAWEAIKNAGRDKDILFFSAYGGQPGYDKVASGEWVGGTALTPQMFAWFCTQTAYRLAKGEKLKDVFMDVPLVLTQKTIDVCKARKMPGVEKVLWVDPKEAAVVGSKGQEYFGKK
jgi:ABC-type sugar transport system substrate-binding protein